MGYTSGILNKMVTILNKKDASSTAFGETTTYEAVGCVHANVTWSKGVKALREGVLDAYDTVLIRMRWNNQVTLDSRLECEGVTYQILSLHADHCDNSIQITAQELNE